jgi:lipopolysaccharide/colanic/teichoic acid biosynthesis glycosyltransferase
MRYCSELVLHYYLSYSQSRVITTSGGLLIKRIFDIVMSAMLLICFSPLLLITSVLIYFESPGSVLFSQQRVGYRGTVFMIWKFRFTKPFF